MLENQQESAWTHAEERYQVGQEVRGVVTRQAQFGVFVQVEPGIEGIIYAFELGPGALASLAPGEEVQLYIKDVDAHKKRLELSLERESTPGLLAERDLPPAARREARREELPDDPFGAAWSELTARRERQLCPTCQRPVLGSWGYCVYCGSTLQRRCPVCGTAQPDLPGAHYCYECGQVLG